MARSSSPAPAAAEDMVLSTETEKGSDGVQGGSTKGDDHILRLGGGARVGVVAEVEARARKLVF